MDAFFTQVGLWVVAQGGGWLVAAITAVALWRVADLLYKTQEKRTDEAKVAAQTLAKSQADLAEAAKALHAANQLLQEALKLPRRR